MRPSQAVSRAARCGTTGLARRFVHALLLVATTSSMAAAQIRGQAIRRPSYGWWLSGGAGAVVLGDIADGATQTRWSFGSDPLWQMRGTLEKAIDQATTLGVSVGYGVVDLTVSPLVAVVTDGEVLRVPESCRVSCEAETELWTLMGQFRSGGGPGFHTLFQASGGVTGFRNMRTRLDTAAIGNPKGQFDLSGSLGAGFGYTLSPGFVVELVQDFGIGWHAKTDLPAGTGRTWRARTTRAGLRFAFGG